MSNCRTTISLNRIQLPDALYYLDYMTCLISSIDSSTDLNNFGVVRNPSCSDFNEDLALALIKHELGENSASLVQKVLCGQSNALNRLNVTFNAISLICTCNLALNKIQLSTTNDVDEDVIRLLRGLLLRCQEVYICREYLLSQVNKLSYDLKEPKNEENLISVVGASNSERYAISIIKYILIFAFEDANRFINACKRNCSILALTQQPWLNHWMLSSNGLSSDSRSDNESCFISPDLYRENGQNVRIRKKINKCLENSDESENISSNSVETHSIVEAAISSVRYNTIKFISHELLITFIDSNDCQCATSASTDKILIYSLNYLTYTFRDISSKYNLNSQ